MMCYSTQTRVSVKGYGYLFFAKNMGKNVDKNVLILVKSWVVTATKNYWSCQTMRYGGSLNCFKETNSKKGRGNWWFDW